LMRLTLGEGAKLAAIGADIGVVDVAVDDIADNFAPHSLAELVGCGDDTAAVGVARGEQPHDFCRIQAGAGLSASDNALDRRVNRDRMCRWHPRSHLRTRRPIVVTREALGVAQPTNLRS